MKQIIPPKPKGRDEIGNIINTLEDLKARRRGDRRKQLEDIILKLICYKNEI